MKIKILSNYQINLGYSYLRSQGLLYSNNSITEKIDEINNNFNDVIPKSKIDFHHTKLLRRMLLSKNTYDFSIIKELNKTDLFDLTFVKGIIPSIIEYQNKVNFKDFYKKEILPLEYIIIKNKSKLITNSINHCLKFWNINSPKEITIINNSLRDGGHFDLITTKEVPIITINLSNPYDNMIKHLIYHEFSHYFQNKIFNELDNEIKDKEFIFKNNKDYSEWKSYLAENFIEAVIFTLINPPPIDKQKSHLFYLKSKYDLIEQIITTINKNNFKKIGLKETKIIIDSLK